MPDEIEVVEALWQQDLDSLMAQVSACVSDIVLAVGHNPFICEATARLTGSHVEFATGGLAAISLPDTLNAQVALPAGRLLWFVQGPLSRNWKTLVQIEGVLGSAADAVGARMSAFAADANDPETNHKLRVSIRTLRSLLAFVAPWQNRAQNKRLRANLKEIVTETSRLRELDVFARQAGAMEEASLELAGFCADATTAERTRVVKALSSKRLRKLLERTITDTHHIVWRKGISAHGLAAEAVRERFDNLASKLSANLAKLDVADAERTHDVRKSAKQVRYCAERFAELIGDDAIDIAKSMEAHQDDLGAICDARVNIDIVDSLAAQAPTEPIAWDLALLRAQNETFLYTKLRDAKREEA